MSVLTNKDQIAGGQRGSESSGLASGRSAAFGRDCERKAGLRAGPRCRHHVDKYYIVRKHVPRRGTGRVLITCIAIAHTNRLPGVCRNVAERHLPSIATDCRHLDPGEAAPTRVNVGVANKLDAALRRRGQIGARRRGGAVAFWFGWQSYFPFSELWLPPAMQKKK